MIRFAIALAAVLAVPALARAQEEAPPPPVRKDPALAPERTVELVFGTPVPRSVSLRGDRIEGSARMDVPDGIESQSRGTFPPLIVRLEYEEKDFSAVGGGIRWDFDFFQLSFDYYEGTWDGEGDLVVEDPPSATTSRPVDLDGDFRALKFALYWPGLRVSFPGIVTSLGVELGAGWHHEEIDPVPESPLPLEDRVDELIGTIGPRLSFRVVLDRFELAAEVAELYLFGASRGSLTEISLGLGLRF